MLVGVSVILALTLLILASNGLHIIKSKVDDVTRANSIERYAYRAILEEKNYLLNTNGSVMNDKNAYKALTNADSAIKNINQVLDEIDKSEDTDTKKTIVTLKDAIAKYDVFYSRAVYLLTELETEAKTLHEEGENITLQIQQYVEAKRVEAKGKLSQKTMAKINAGSNVWQYTYVTRADEKRYLLTPDDMLYGQLKKDYAFMMSELERLKGMSDQPYEHEKIELFYNSANDYEKAMSNWVKYNKELVSIVLPKIEEVGNSVISKALNLAHFAVENIEEKRTNLMMVLISSALVAVVFGVLFGTFIARSITSIISNFQIGLLEFFTYLDMQKNSAKQIPIESKDEIALMAKVVNENIMKIEEVMQNKLVQLQEKDEQMRRQSRLAQMGEMISVIAHQWRQPLGTITMTTSDMEVRLSQRHIYDLTTEQGRHEMEIYLVEHLHKINSLVAHLSKTIDDFRNFFRSNKEVSTFSLSEVIDTTINLCGHLLRTNGVEVHKNYNEIDDIRSYKNEVMQVFLTFIHNSVEALGEKNIQKPQIFIVINKNSLGHPVVSIEDNAGGISEAVIDKVFDPYFSTKDKAGTGLGLYMSQMIIQEHCNGLLHVENAEHGARFSIEFLDGEEEK